MVKLMTRKLVSFLHCVILEEGPTKKVLLSFLSASVSLSSNSNSSSSQLSNYFPFNNLHTIRSSAFELSIKLQSNLLLIFITRSFNPFGCYHDTIATSNYSLARPIKLPNRSITSICLNTPEANGQINDSKAREFLALCNIGGRSY